MSLFIKLKLIKYDKMNFNFSDGQILEECVTLTFFAGLFCSFFLMSCSWFFCLNHWIPMDGNGASTNQLLIIQTSTPSNFPLYPRSSFHLRGIPMETLQHASPHSNSRICIKKRGNGGTFKYKMKDILWFVLGVTIQISKEKRFFLIRRQFAQLHHHVHHFCPKLSSWKHHRNYYLVFPTLFKVATSKWVHFARTADILMTGNIFSTSPSANIFAWWRSIFGRW